MDLGVELRSVCYVHRHVLCPGVVEARVGKRQIESVCLPTGNALCHSATRCEHHGDIDKRLAEIDPRYPAAICGGQKSGWPAQSAADVENFRSGFDVQGLGEFSRGCRTAHVKLIEWHEVRPVERSRSQARKPERVGNALSNATAPYCSRTTSWLSILGYSLLDVGSKKA